MRVVNRIEGAAEDAESHEYVNSYADADRITFDRAEFAQFLFDAHLRERALEARQPFIRIEIRHGGEPLDALAR